MSWKDNAGISGQFDRVRELAGQIRKHDEATTQKLMESEEKVKNLLRENAILRQKLLGGVSFHQGPDERA